MLMRHRVGAALALALAIALVAPAPASAAPPQRGQDGEEQASTSGDSSGGEIAAGAGTPAVVESSGSTTSGVPFRQSVTVSVPRRCWYGAGPTGYDYYEHWKDGGPGRNAMTTDAYAAQGLLHPNFEEHATDTEGRWYEAACASYVPTEELRAYMLSHPGVFVPAGTQPPAVVESVDPEILAQVAFEHMQLPTGTIRWNPSLQGSGATLVNMDTFVWVENAATQVQVTASVPGVSSTVTARMSSMRVQADGADATTCADAGTPYAAGMTSSTCAITFRRSSANQPVKAGQTLPTATLTATATWEASWTSSVDPATYVLESQTLTTSAEVPVAEVQSVVTS